MNRFGNNPKRRIRPASSLSAAGIEYLCRSVEYEPSGHHKRKPADYGLERVNPVPTKSLCDLTGTIRKDDAREMLLAGIRKGMLSVHSFGDFPKYVWSVSGDGRVYEAKTSESANGRYHGYPLEANDIFRETVLTEWKRR